LSQAVAGRKLDFDGIVENAGQLADAGTQAVDSCQQLQTHYQAICQDAQVRYTALFLLSTLTLFSVIQSRVVVYMC